MSSEYDSQETEIQAILDAADFTNSRVLEVGSGTGRLTFRYAKACRFVVGVEPKMEALVSAVNASPLDLTVGAGSRSRRRASRSRRSATRRSALPCSRHPCDECQRRARSLPCGKFGAFLTRTARCWTCGLSRRITLSSS